MRDEERGFNAIEAAALWAEEKHMTAIVDKPHANILFAKQMATEAFIGGFNSALDAALEIMKAHTKWHNHPLGPRQYFDISERELIDKIEQLRAEKEDGK